MSAEPLAQPTAPVARRRYSVSPLPQTAALYVRVSTVPQAGETKTSLQTQEENCRRWAADHGWTVDEQLVLVEKHSGEDLWERPHLMRLLQLAKERQFGVLVANSVDRLSRNHTHLDIVYEALTQVGVQMQFVTETFDATPEGGIMRTLKGFSAGNENRQRVERFSRTLRAKADQGRSVSGARASLGYRWPDERDARTGRLTRQRLEIDPETAPLVRRIFSDFTVRGLSLRAIAAALNAEGVQTSTQRAGRQDAAPLWLPGVIRAILRNSLYWGEGRTSKTKAEPVPSELRARPDQPRGYRRKVRNVLRPAAEQPVLRPDFAPALVSPEEGAEVVRRLALNPHLGAHNALEPEGALLRGLVRCNLCGGALRAVRNGARRRRNGSVPMRYICRNALRLPRGGGQQCPHHSIAADVLDRKVWQAVAERLSNPSLLRDELTRERDGETAPEAAAIADLDAQLADLAGQRESWLRVAGFTKNEADAADVAAHLGLLSERRSGKEQERAKLVARQARWEAHRDALDDTLARIQQAARTIDQWDFSERRQALVDLDTTVTVYPPGHRPRAHLDISLPLSGTLALPVHWEDGDVAALDDGTDDTSSVTYFVE
jgi:site-specific DNA recombinase